MRLRIGDDIFQVKKATTPSSRKKGLKGVKSMPKDAGLLLVLEEPKVVPITMEGVKFDLDLVFILDNVVVGIKTAPVGSADTSSDVEVDSVLELNAGVAETLVVGEDVVTVGSKKDDGKIETPEEFGEGMHVLDEDGNLQVSIKGDERVYSRIHTKQLVEAAVKAYESKDDKDYKKVGRAMVRMIDKQDTQKEQYSEN